MIDLFLVHLKYFFLDFFYIVRRSLILKLLDLGLESSFVFTVDVWVVDPFPGKIIAGSFFQMELFDFLFSELSVQSLEVAAGLNEKNSFFKKST